MQKRKIRLLRALIACGVAVVAVGAGAAHAEAAKVVQVRGGDEFEPNRFVANTFRFAPGTITVRPRERVTWVDAGETPAPHTVTIVRKANLPDTLEEVFECEICAIALGHLENPENPEQSDIKTVRLNVGRPGLDRQGDSLFFPPKGRISARVTANAGRNLHYLCAIHPWMQGKIRVRAAAAGARLAGSR